MANPLAELLSGRVSPARGALGPTVLPRNQFSPAPHQVMESRTPYVSENIADLMAKAIHGISGKPYEEALADSKMTVGLVPGVNAGADTNEGMGDIEQSDYASGALNLASAFSDAVPGGHAAAGAVSSVLKPAILHMVPNLFKRAALEDAARGVDPDSIWKQWGWEKYRPAGWNGTTYRDEQWITETPDVGAKLRTDVDTSGDGVGKLPLRREQLTKTEVDPAQLTLPFYNQDLARTSPLYRAPLTNEMWEMKPNDYSSLSAYPKPKVPDFVDHPALFNEPGLEEIFSTPMFRPSGPLMSGNTSAAGVFNIPTSLNPKGSVVVKTPGHDELGTTIHEIQHKAQNMFDMPGGFSPSAPGAAQMGRDVRDDVYATLSRYEKAINQRTQDYWAAEDAWLKTIPEDARATAEAPEHIRLKGFNRQWALDNPGLQMDLDRKWQLPKNMQDIGDINSFDTNYLGYHAEGGETAARNATRRAKMSLRDLNNTRPELTEDVPRFLQWDNYYQRPPAVKPFKEPEKP